jgi:outer membrane protein assembly factor BamB
MKIFRLASVVIATSFLSPIALAKRGTPKPVNAIVSSRVRYIAPSVMPKYRSIYGAPTCEIGCVEARNDRTGKLLWKIEVYQIKSDPQMETDVQDVFISALSIERGKLIVENEAGAKYSVDLKTRAIHKY